MSDTVLFYRRGHAFTRYGDKVRCARCTFTCELSRAASGGPKCEPR